MMMKATRRSSLLMIACLVLSACSSIRTDPTVEESRQLLDSGHGEEALVRLEQAAREHPENRQYRSEYFRERDLMVAQWIGQAESLRVSSQFGPAADLYRKVLKYDAENVRAKNGLSQLEIDQSMHERLGEVDELIKAEKYREAEEKLRPVLIENRRNRDAQRLQRLIEEKTAKPAVAQLRIPASKPISLELRDVPLRSAFEVIGRAANINFMFDKDVKSDQKTTVVVKDAKIEEAIRLVLTSNQLDYKVLNETTALVFPNTPQKQRDYQELVVKSFYLANADVKQTANMIRTILKTKDVFIDEKLGLLVMRDSPKAIRLAEKLIASQDLAEPEVMLEVEVLEVGANRLLDLGARYPQSLAVGIQGAGGVPGQVTLPEWLKRDSSLVRLSFQDPLFLLSLRQEDGTTNVLANPRIRVKNKEKARIHIGDRVPVITTTAAVAGGFVSESVSYLDVGLKLEVEPVVYLEDEVGITMGLEVSNIVREVRGSSGNTLTYQIGTRNTSTVLRLHDGETQVLAGLISDEDRRTASRVPGLGDMPVVGRLFSETNSNRTKTEIVLLITPHLIRTLDRPGARTTEFSAGTETSVEGPAVIGSGPAPMIIEQMPAQPPQRPAPAPAAPAPAAPPGNTMVPFGGVQQPQPYAPKQ
jgi:general secretion pathway protein D